MGDGGGEGRIGDGGWEWCCRVQKRGERQQVEEGGGGTARRTPCSSIGGEEVPGLLRCGSKSSIKFCFLTRLALQTKPARQRLTRLIY